MFEVSNYDFCSSSFYESEAGLISEVGYAGEFQSEAAEILGLKYDESEPEAWADIVVNWSTGKQYAACGDSMVTVSNGRFYFKELELSQYVNKPLWAQALGLKIINI